MLNEISRRLREGGHAWSEEIGCSTYVAANMTAITLRSHHQGKPFTFKHGMRISPDTFKKKLTEARSVGRLYHPVKYG
jgi:hypothetical protein